MSIYRLDLDALKETRDEYQLSATKAGENIDTSHEVINKTDINIFAGDDANTFRLDFTNYVDNDMQQMQETLFKMKEILTDGLNDARACKKLCNDFVITLGGGGNGKSAEDMQGELYCDQSAINGLKEYCRSALSYSDSIRTICTSINDTLWELVIVKLYPTPYTSAIKEGCDKVDRLEDHSRELGNYAEAAETINDSFESALLVFSAPFISDLTLETYTGSISPQEEAIMKIMEQKDELSEMDKEILEENLRIMEENGDIEGIQKVAEHSGNKGNGEWTPGDVYVMAHIYNYAENNANAELATAVYDKMKKVTYVQTTNSGRPPYTTFTYEFGLDENKVSDILAELDPEKDGLAYYSLQRRSKYCETKIINKNGTNAEVPEMDLTIQFTQDESGNLVSVFTVDGKETRLASVDMNEVVGQKWEDSPMKGMGFSKEERIALMSSIYTDEDIWFINDLVKAEIQSDYCDLFLQYDADNLGITTANALYQYSYGLVDNTFEFDEKGYLTQNNLGQFEKFLNGLLETNVYVTSDINDYLISLAAQSSLQMDSVACAMSKSRHDQEKLNLLIPNFELNSRLYGLYAGLLSQMELYVDLGVSNVGNCIQISELAFQKTENVGLENGVIDITKSNFIYYENLMWKDYDGELQKCFDGNEQKTITLNIYSGNDSLSRKKTVELIRAEKEKKMAVPKALVKTGISVASVFQPWVGVVAEVVKCATELDGSAAKDVAKDAADIANNQYFDGSSSGKAGIAVINGVAESIIEYQEAKGKVDSIQSDIETSLFGETIVLRGTSISVVEEGVYTSNMLLKNLEFKENGLSFMAKEKKEEVANLIMSLREDDEKNEKLLEENDKKNKEMLRSECVTLENSTSLKENEIIPALYLVWTGEPFEYEDGTKSKLDSMDKLKPSEIEGCMDSLNVVSNRMIVDSVEWSTINITADSYKEYNILK